MRHARRNSEDIFREVIDPIEQTASPGDEDAFAEIVEKWLLFERALEEFKSLAQTHVNNRIQRLALHFFSREPGIVFQQDRLAREACARGIHEFTASYYADNVAIRHLLCDIGHVVKSGYESGEGFMRLSLDGASG